MLNPLEAEIMDLMWRKKQATASFIYNRLKSRCSVRRSAVNVAMNSLCKRGLLTKKVSKGRGGLKYVFKVRSSRTRFEREIIDRVIDSLLDSFGKTARKRIKERLKRV